MIIDGDTGALRDPDARFGAGSTLTYLQQVGITARLNTKRGYQLMRPNYGLDLRPLIDRPITGEGLADLNAAIARSLVGFPVRVSVRVRSGQTVIAVGSQ